jgi:hypothetical protein
MNLTVQLVENSTLLVHAAAASLEKKVNEQTILVTYTAKIRGFEGDTVFVSLFPSEVDGDEIAGELDRRQFPEGKLNIGQIFKYRVVTKEPGKTEVDIVPVQKLSIHHDDLIDLWKKVSRTVPSDEKAAQG